MLKSHSKRKVINPYFHFARISRTQIRQLATRVKNCPVRDTLPKATVARSSGNPLEMIVAVLWTRQRLPVVITCRDRVKASALIRVRST